MRENILAHYNKKDLMKHGFSDASEVDFSYEILLKDFKDFIDELNLEKSNVAGVNSETEIVF